MADLDQANEEILVRDVVFVDMVVTTPGRLLGALEKKNGLLKNVRHVVLDEADLLLSFGYDEEMKWAFFRLQSLREWLTLGIEGSGIKLRFLHKDIFRKIRKHLPQSYQSVFTSATLVEDMSAIKELFVTGPVVSLKLKVIFFENCVQF